MHSRPARRALAAHTARRSGLSSALPIASSSLHEDRNLEIDHVRNDVYILDIAATWYSQALTVQTTQPDVSPLLEVYVQIQIYKT